MEADCVTVPVLVIVFVGVCDPVCDPVPVCVTVFEGVCDPVCDPVPVLVIVFVAVPDDTTSVVGVTDTEAVPEREFVLVAV